jgi:hypothetical protein
MQNSDSFHFSGGEQWCHMVFLNQKKKKKQFAQISVGLAMGDVGIFYCHSVNFTAKWYILWPFVAFCGHLVYFSRFWYKSGNHGVERLVQNGVVAAVT